MIVKNEERFLEQCLRSVADVVDEICIVDTGSTDRTIEIAKSFGAKVVEREWRNDFAWARNEALSMATRRWTIMLDADEELTVESKSALQVLKAAPAFHTGVWVRCYNESDDYRGTGAMSHALVRIFPTSERIGFRGMIHEFVSLDNGTEGLGAVIAPISIVHHGYLKEVVESRDKAKRNYEIVRAAADADPSDPFAWFNVGSTAFMMRDFEQARDAFEKMRSLNGKAPRGFISNGYAILAEVYSDKLGDAVKGEEIARGALEFSPHYANAHFQLGKTLVAQQRYDEARAAFLAAIDDGKYSAQQFVVDDQVSIWKAHSEIGASYVAQQDDASAIEWFRKGLENAPKVQPLRLNLARALERTGKTGEALELFRGVFEDFGDAAGAVDYVNFLLRQNRGSDAIDVIEAVHATLDDETAVPLLYAAAQIAVSLQRDALRYLELGAERDPANAEILNWLEPLYREGGNEAALALVLEREAEIEPSTAAQYLRRSYHANVARDFQSGLAFAERGCEVDSGNEHLRYNAAVSAAAIGERERALEHLRFVQTAGTPVFIPAEMLRANVLQSLDRYDEAVAAVERILANDVANAEGLLLRAGLYEKLGDLQGAETSLRRLMETDRGTGAVHFAGFLLRHGRFEDAARVADAALGK